MKNRFLAILTVGLLAGPMAANAIPVTISGFGAADGVWEVTLLGPTNYDTSSATLLSQVWWGNMSLAAEFSDLVNTALGEVNPADGFGPQFAHNPTGSFAWDFNDNRTESWGYPSSFRWTFAVASRSEVPEPGTLALLALGLAGTALSRRRKVN